MQSLKNIVISRLVVLGLSSGLMVSALATVAVEPPSFEEWLSAQDSSYDYVDSETAVADAETAVAYVQADMAAAQLDFSELDADSLKIYADAGNADAQSNLGVMYERGEGVRQDYTQARHWYEKAAKQGNAMAQSNLGVMYERGEGVRENSATAKEWFGKSCDNGYQKGCDSYRRLNQKQAVIKSK